VLDDIIERLIVKIILKTDFVLFLLRMRKIISRAQKNKETKRNQIIIGVILIGIMLFGTLGYAFGGGEENSNADKLDYGGIEFVQDGSGYWHFNIQGYDFVTKYNPLETKDILFFDSLTINEYISKPLYFVSESNEPIFEIAKNLEQFVLRINERCLDEACEKDFPVKNCSIENVIVIKESVDEINEIKQEENCVFITASFEEQTRYTDAFLFRILGL